MGSSDVPRDSFFPELYMSEKVDTVLEGHGWVRRAHRTAAQPTSNEPACLLKSPGCNSSKQDWFMLVHARDLGSTLEGVQGKQKAWQALSLQHVFRLVCRAAPGCLLSVLGRAPATRWAKALQIACALKHRFWQCLQLPLWSDSLGSGQAWGFELSRAYRIQPW